MSERRRRIYLDSSVLVGAVIDGVNHAAAYQRFCEEVITDRSTVVISTLNRYELAHLASMLGNPTTRRALPEHVVSQFNLAEWDRSIHVRDRWMAGMANTLEALRSSFNDLAEIPVLPEFWNASRQIMTLYDFQSFDALHVVTSQFADVDEFATTDRQFVRIDGLNVHLTRDG